MEGVRTINSTRIGRCRPPRRELEQRYELGRLQREFEQRPDESEQRHRFSLLFFRS
jgi:hypothetical protein